MGKRLSRWATNASIEMKKRGNMSIEELASKLESKDGKPYSRQQISGVLNCRVFSEPAINKISDYLNISTEGVYDFSYYSDD